MFGIRVGEILKSEYYSSMGTIVTIKFSDVRPPTVGDVLKAEGVLYKICGAIIYGSSVSIKENMVRHVYDCRIERMD